MDARTLKQEFRGMALHRKQKNSRDVYSETTQSHLVSVCNNCNRILADCNCEITFTLKEIIETIEFFENFNRDVRTLAKLKK